MVLGVLCSVREMNLRGPPAENSYSIWAKILIGSLAYWRSSLTINTVELRQKTCPLPEWPEGMAIPCQETATLLRIQLCCWLKLWPSSYGSIKQKQDEAHLLSQ